MTNPTNQFNVFIPVTFTTAQTVYFYIGYQKKDPTTNKTSLVYI